MTDPKMCPLGVPGQGSRGLLLAVPGQLVPEPGRPVPSCP